MAITEIINVSMNIASSSQILNINLYNAFSYPHRVGKMLVTEKCHGDCVVASVRFRTCDSVKFKFVFSEKKCQLVIRESIVCSSKGIRNSSDTLTHSRVSETQRIPLLIQGHPKLIGYPYSSKGI